MTDSLADFVKSALSRGVPREEIASVLRRAGWTADQVATALAAFAEVEFSIPVPRPRPYVDAREAFLYLVLFTTLYVSAFHVGSLLFNLINIALPDPADRQRAEWVRSSMRFSIASLVVAFPVFLYLSWLIARDLKADPNRQSSKIRRWLTYLTLFLASAILIGDVIALIYSLLGGEITTRFLLKVCVIGAIAGAVFWYYLSSVSEKTSR